MYAAIASEFGIRELNDDVAFAGRTDRAIGRDLFLKHGIADSDENRQRFTLAYLRQLPESLNTRPGRVLPGVAELLGQLYKRERIVIGLLTGNLRRGAAAKLSHYSINHFFQFGGFGDRHFDRCDVASEAIAALSNHISVKIPPRDVWVIGDTPLDIQCARSIGARVLAVCTGFHSARELESDRPDMLVEDLSNTAEIIAAIGRGE
jgi:phosphoglycolate phosphatase-like HAD superfamily hydrolase